MAKSKTAIIKEYLQEHPDATGKTAEQDLKKFGINAQYFSSIKSTSQSGKKGTKKKRAKKKSLRSSVKRKIPRSAAAPSLEDLQTVAEFAIDFGGLEKLSAAVETLRRFQMKAV